MERPLLSKNTALEHGWRVLAGSFSNDESWLLETMMRYLESTGARVAVVEGWQGLEIWRDGSEMETQEETQERLEKHDQNRIKKIGAKRQPSTLLKKCWSN